VTLPGDSEEFLTEFLAGATAVHCHARVVPARAIQIPQASMVERGERIMRTIWTTARGSKGMCRFMCRFSS
jgi:hypothetical protein